MNNKMTRINTSILVNLLLIFVSFQSSVKWKASAFTDPSALATFQRGGGAFRKTKQSSSSALASSTVTADTSNDKSITILSKTRVGGSDGGYYHRVKHSSSSTKTDMTFGLFLPQNYDDDDADTPTPVMFWLSGLTCDDTNFAQKAGGNAFAAANRENIALVIPDTSPRGDNVPDVDSYDLGVGAGFYVDATEEPYSENFNMRTYVTSELPALLHQHFNIGVKSISGHSMG